MSTRTAVITGSTSGIGLGIARALAAKGSNIVMNGIEKPDAVEPLRLAIEKDFGVKAVYSGANMMKPEGAAELIEVANSAFGQVDILVNNAGIQFVSPVEDFPHDKWQAIINLNLSSVFYTSNQVVAGMKQRRWGRIVNIASAHGLVASPFKSAYVAAKHGVLGFTKSLALEVAEAGITVNAICPGYVWTPLVESQIPDTMKARNMSEEEVKRDVLLKAQPTKRFVTIDEVAAMAVFLCSEDARSITGSAQSIDGGWVAQ